jgi:hypothetical protein
MKQVSAPQQYDRANEQSFRNAAQEADAQNVKKNTEWNAARLVLTDTDTGARYQVTVASGVLTLVAL